MKPNKRFLMLSIFFVGSSTRTVHNDVLQDIVIATAASTAEVVIDQPLIYVKNMHQQGKSISFNPRMWQSFARVAWHGAHGNVTALAPVTAIQIIANKGILEQLKQGNGEVSALTKTGISFIAGALSGLVSCPSENIMLHQQNTGERLYPSVAHIFRAYGIRGMYRALAPTMIRDGGFTAGLLGLRPITKEKLEDIIQNEAALTLISGIGAGVAVGIATHPADTLKTVMQAYLPDKALAQSLTAFRKITQKSSARGFYKGVIARTGRVASGVTIMGLVIDQLNAMIKTKDDQE